MTTSKLNSRFTFAVFAAACSSTPIALAQFSVPRQVVACGGGESFGGTFDLTGTVGQNVVGPDTGPMTGGTFALAGGFWPGQPSPCPSDFNHDGFVTGDDFDAFVAVFIVGDPAADFNHDGFVTADDYDSYVDAFFGGC